MRLFPVALFVFSLLCFNAHAQTKILAQVNDDIISELDFQQRLAFIRLTGQADTQRKDVREQILKQLIDEKLKMQEAHEAGIEISDSEVLNAVKITLQQNGMNYETVTKELKKNGLPLSVIEDQIKADLMYVRAIKKNAGSRADISDREISEKMEEIKEQFGQKQYLVSEILLPVPDPEQDAEVYGQAMNLIMQMRDGAEFEKIAAEYSKAPSAKKGGMVGWIGEKALSEEIKEEFSVLPPGQLSTPVKTEAGYKIFVLHAVRDPENLNQAQEIVHLIQLFVPDSFTEKQKKAVLRDLNMTKGSCDQFKAVSEQLKTSSRIDLGKLPLDKLPNQIRSVINRTALLEPSLPLPIEEGSLIFMTCSRENTSFLPDKEEIKMQLEGGKLEALAQRRLRELRRSAVTEIR
ncbi:MAG: peptidylprolyl isomerase [Alphaproteobacteria bacterium]|nr:peptidylprolyl isomerase [Alphaproteobacteria bacterium]